MGISHFILDKNVQNFRKSTALFCAVALIAAVGYKPVQAEASYMQRYMTSSIDEKIKSMKFNPAVYDGVISFYQQRDFAPLWVDEGQGLIDKANVVISELERAWQHGLNPQKYLDKDILGANYSRRKSVLARSEFLLSYGLALYAHDMTSMRVDPKAIKQHEEYWRKPIAPSVVLNTVAEQSDLRSYIHSLEPQNGLYKRLKKEYVQMVTSDEFHQPQVEVTYAGIIQPGQSHKTVAQFRARMGMPKLDGMDNYVYDDALVEKISAFQKDNGLKTDGVLGPQTVKYLNRTARERADQLLANMERMRWIEPDRPKKYIEVNIPSMSLWGFEDGQATLNMPVIVGRTYRPTKSFVAEITGVRINPRWTVPHRIRTQDYWPKMKEDPSVLLEKKIDVIEGYGHEAIYHDPTAIDWKNMGWREFNKYRLVQQPGDHNALGRIRVLMPNQHVIYLHDTNHPELFDQDYRSESSGCIRLKYPEKVAEFILKGNDIEWGTPRMQEIYDSLKPKDLMVEHKMPIYILYQTNWLNARGEIVYGPDLYKEDRKLIAALDKQGDYYVPARDAIDEDMKIALR